MFVCLDFSSRRCTLFTFLSPFLLSLPRDYVPRFWDSFKSIALCFFSVNTLFKFFSSPLFSLSFLLFCSFCFPFQSFPVNYFKNNLLPRISCPKRTYRRKQRNRGRHDSAAAVKSRFCFSAYSSPSLFSKSRPSFARSASLSGTGGSSSLTAADEFVSVSSAASCSPGS